MYTMTKRGTVFALALLMLVMSVFVPMKKAEAAMMYNNTGGTSISCTVDSNGRLQATLIVNGKSGITTHIGVKLYVEKRVLGIFWSRVNIGCDDNLWIDSTNNYNYRNVFSVNLTASGTYRTTVTYTVSGTGGGNDIITQTDTVTY